MSYSLNRVSLLGNLGKDPEVRSTQDGRKVVSFSIATSESWKDKNSGEKREHTDWHNIVIFNEGLAGIAESLLKKGSKVFIEGKLQTRKWTDQSGQDRYTTEVVLSNGPGAQLILCEKATSNRPPPAEEGGYGAQSESRGPDLDDQIPF